MELFDTHAHYDAAEFDEDREAVLSDLADAGVTLVMNPGCDPGSSQTAAALARRFPQIYAAVGIHPEECGGCREEDLEVLRTLAGEEKVRAIGEIGLDYYWEENPSKEVQRGFFRDQMKLAEELDLPVIVHDREAHADCLAVVKEFPKVRGVFHCFSGSAEMACELVKRG